MELNEQNLPLKDWCDYLIYVTGGGALKNLKAEK
jgi:hypothetical protein